MKTRFYGVLAAAAVLAAVPAFGQKHGDDREQRTAEAAPEPEVLTPAPAEPRHLSLLQRGLNAPVTGADEPGGNAMTPVGQLSYFSVPTAEQRKFKKHDLVTIIIREDSDGSSTGKGKSEKKQDFDLALQQFVKLGSSNGLLSLSKAANPASLPEVQFHFDNKRDNNAEQDRTDHFAARVTAEIVDVKPNGNLVIEATKRIQQDKEIQDFKLSGVCRAADVSVDNTLLSTQLGDLALAKNTTGEVRDGTKRGWLNRVIDTVNPF